MQSSRQSQPFRVLVVCWELGKPSETFIEQIATRLPNVSSCVEWNKIASKPKRLSFPIGSWFSSNQSEDERRRRAFDRILKTGKFDLVLIQTGPLGALCRASCIENDIPFVVQFHGIDAYSEAYTGPRGGNYAKLFRDASGLVCSSTHMVHQLVQLGAPKERVFYLSYFVDPQKFAASTTDYAEPKFLAVGRFVEKKAPLLTLMAFSKVLTKVPNAKLVMIGDGPLLNACKQYVRAAKCHENVEFLGVQSHEQVAYWMTSARAFVQHSVTGADNDHEGTPVSIIEAQVSALPVVSTRHAGIPDVVIDEQTGYLVDEFDVETMAARMTELAEEPQLARRLGQCGRICVLERFSYERTMGALDTLLCKLIHKSSNSGPFK